MAHVPHIRPSPEGFYLSRTVQAARGDRFYAEMLFVDTGFVRRLGTSIGYYRVEEEKVTVHRNGTFCRMRERYYRLTPKSMVEVSPDAGIDGPALSPPDHHILLRHEGNAAGCEVFASWPANNQNGVLAVIRKGETSASVSYMTLGGGEQRLAHAAVSWDGLTAGVILLDPNPNRYTFIQFDL